MAAVATVAVTVAVAVAVVDTKWSQSIQWTLALDHYNVPGW